MRPRGVLNEVESGKINESDAILLLLKDITFKLEKKRIPGVPQTQIEGEESQEEKGREFKTPS